MFSVGFPVYIYIYNLGERRSAQAVGLCGVLGSIRGQCSDIYGGQTGAVTSFSPGTSVLPCQYNSANAPYSSSSTH
jgi:hypothetical protein